MASVNKAIVLGNLGQDPEVRYTQSGAAVCSLSVATTRSWKDKNSGDKQGETEWHRIVCYDRLAEVAGEYLRKGKPVYIEGRLKTRKWQDKEGIERYTTEIVAEHLQLLGGRDSGGGENEAAAQQRNRADDRQQRGKPAQRQTQQRASSAPAARQQPANDVGSFDDMDDDIPF